MLTCNELTTTLDSGSPVGFDITTSGAAMVVVGIVAHTAGPPRAGGDPSLSGVGSCTQADQLRYYSPGGETFVELWYIQVPSADTYSLVVPNTGSKSLRVFTAEILSDSGVIEYTGAGGATGLSAHPGTTVTVSRDSSIAIAVVGSGGDTFSSAFQLNGYDLFDEYDDGASGAGIYYLPSDAGSVNPSWVYGISDDWAICAVVFSDKIETLIDAAATTEDAEGAATMEAGVITLITGAVTTEDAVGTAACTAYKRLSGVRVTAALGGGVRVTLKE